jgi:hypothetical protein
VSSPTICSPPITNKSSQEMLDASEQLHLPFQDGEQGIPPLRLLEPISSLHLTPFAAKAVRGIGVATVGNLAIFVFDPSKECRSLGQGHIEEIRRKIEHFVGKPPYAREQRLEISSLLRLSLCNIDPSEKALIVTQCQLQQIAPLSPQESREAEVSLTRDKERKFQQAIEKVRLKDSEKIRALLDMIFCGFVRPWMQQRGGIAHEREIFMFLFEIQVIDGQGGLLEYRLFEKSLTLLTLIADTSFLFSQSLCHVEGKIWALSPPEQVRTLEILQDAKMLIGKGREGVGINALAIALEECRFEQWDPSAHASTERLLFWYYLDR